MGYCIITQKPDTGKYSGSVQGGSSTKIASAAPTSDYTSYANDMYLGKSTNYPFFKITGYSRCAGDHSSGWMCNGTSSTSVGAQTKNITEYGDRSGSSGKTSFGTSATIGSAGNIIIFYRNINENYGGYYGGDVNYVYINHSDDIAGSFFDSLTSFYVTI